MIHVDIEDPAWVEALPDAEAVVTQAAALALQSGGAGIEAQEVTVLLADDAAIAELNERFRGKAGPTNVLSFPAPEFAQPHLGDVALAFGVCTREAGQQGKPLRNHLTHLVAHGVLHLLGWDHQTEEEAEAMEAAERQILAGMDMPDPYGPEYGAPD